MSDSPYQLQMVTERPLNAETPREALTQDVTPNALFYVRNHFDIPRIEAHNWALDVDGALGEARNFRLEELKTLGSRSLQVVLECAGNGRNRLNPPVKGTAWGEGAVAMAEFRGVPLWSVLERVQPEPEVIEVQFTGADKGVVRTGEHSAYSRSLSLREAQDPDVLLAWEMNGAALPEAHGYPLRLLVPGRYGMASVKWLERITLLTKPYEGFFQKEDYVYQEAQDLEAGTPVGEIRVRSLLTSHANGDELLPGDRELAGLAWSGIGAITKVEFSLDGGENWQAAELDEPASPYAWTRWRVKLESVVSGDYEVLLRAADSAGNEQPMEQYWNRGGYGNNPAQKVNLRLL